MERRASRSSTLWLALALALALVTCAPSVPTCGFRASKPPPTVPPGVVVPYKVAGGGEIRFTVKQRYSQGGSVTFDLDISAGSQPIIGPLSGVILQSDLAGEQTVRRFAPHDLTTLDVAPGGRGKTTVTWDGKRDDGFFVPAGTFSLALDFIVGGVDTRLGTVIEVRAP